MTKKYYTAQVVFSSASVRVEEDLDVVLEDYRRNTQLVSISTDYGYPNITKTIVTLLISSKNSDKAQKTMELIINSIKYYSGFNCCIFECTLGATFEPKMSMNSYGDLEIYVK